MLRKLVFKEGTRRVVSVGIYVFFFGFVIYSALNSRDSAALPVYGLFVVFLLFAALDEYLRYQYSRAAALVAEKCQPAQAIGRLEKMQKFDIIKGYRTKILFLKQLALLDSGRPEAALQLAEENMPLFTRKPANAIMLNYLVFCACYQSGQWMRAKETYQLLTQIPGDAFAKAVPFCHPPLLKAQSLLMGAKAEEALELLQSRPPQGYSNREQAYYYLAAAKASRILHKYEEERDLYAKAAQAAPGMQPVAAYRPKIKPE